MTDYALRVLVADDDPDARHILSTYLTHYGYHVLAAADGDQAWEMAMSNGPDLALLDVVMPGPSGVELLERLKMLESAPEVILLTAFATVAQAVEAMKRGAFDYLQKPFSPRRVLDVVERAWTARQQQLEKTSPLHELTLRERQVLALLAEGKTDGEMAEVLGVSVRTINAHVSGILSKLGVSGRLQAALMWQRAVVKWKKIRDYLRADSSRPP